MTEGRWAVGCVPTWRYMVMGYTQRWGGVLRLLGEVLHGLYPEVGWGHGDLGRRVYMVMGCTLR